MPDLFMPSYECKINKNPLLIPFTYEFITQEECTFNNTDISITLEITPKYSNKTNIALNSEGLYVASENINDEGEYRVIITISTP